MRTWRSRRRRQRQQTLPATVEKPAESPKPKAADPAGDFKNDPLIKKALEIFAGEIQTASK